MVLVKISEPNYEEELEMRKIIDDVYYSFIDVKNAFGAGMKVEARKNDDARAETIKEFAERLKNLLLGWETEPTDEEIERIIDNLVKEMLGKEDE
jgi:hypothetical protein